MSTKWHATDYEREFDGGIVFVRKRIGEGWKYIITFDDDRPTVNSWPPFADAEAAMAAADAQVTP